MNETKVKIIKVNSPILKSYGVKIGMIGIKLENDFEEKYDYRILVKSINQILYFYKNEIEEIND